MTINSLATPGSSKAGLSGSHQGSQTAIEAAIVLYSIVAALVLVRSIFKTIGVLDSLRTGKIVYAPTDLMVLPLTLLPGADVELINDLTMADFALFAIIVAIPFGILALSKRHG